MTEDKSTDINEIIEKINDINQKISSFEEKINTYNNLIDKQVKSNKKLTKKIDELIKLTKNDNKLTDDSNNKHKQLLNNLNEIRYGTVFNDTIKNTEWLTIPEFSLNNAASNYSFMYVLYRILNEVRPDNILELGLGQTSKLTSQYANYFDKNLDIVEDNEKWIDEFSKSQNINKRFINHIEYIEVTIDDSVNRKYSDLSPVVKDNKYDLIIIDGPLGYGMVHPRTNILDIIDNLSEDFIIVLDDYDRVGEKNTAKELFKLLEERDIEYYSLVLHGTKHQLIVTTEKSRFVTWF